MLRASDYIDLMRHALGKTPDPRHDLWATLNRAGRQLTTVHPWTWRRRGPIDLPAVAGQRHIDLPDDFASIISVTVDNTASANYFRVEQVPVHFIQDLYQNRLPLGDVGFYVAFESYAPQRSRDEAPRRRLLCYPEPTEDLNPTLRVIYDQRWRELTKNDQDAVPNIPEEFEDALVSLARAKAYRLENNDASIDEQSAADEIQRLVREDGRTQKEYGHMIGGASSRRERIATLRVGIADVAN